MTIKRSKQIVFVSLFLSLVLHVSTSFAQDCREVEYNNVLIPDSVFASVVDDDLAERRVSIQVTNESLSTIVYRLAFDHGIQIGFEESTLDRAHGNYVFEPYFYATQGRINRCHPGERFDPGKFGITLNVENQELETVLTEIVRQMKNYNWEVRGGMVNLFPIEKRDPSVESFLDLKISEFRFKAGRKIIHLFEDLQKTIEVREFRKLKKIEILMNRGSVAGDGLDLVLRTEIEFKGLTVRELLNKLGRLNRVGWIIRTEEPGSKIRLGI